MPKNSELQKEILELDSKFVVDDLNNAELSAALKQLKEAEAAAEAEAEAAAEAEVEAKAVAKAKAEAAGHVVAKGRAITSKRGIIGPGDSVTAADLDPNGDETFEYFVELGFIVEAKG